MAVNYSHLLELATHRPERISKALEGLDNRERLVLLDKVASGGVSRRIADVLGRAEHRKKTPLALDEGVTVFLAKSSFPALGSFELHMFRDQGKRIWGRTVTMVPTFVGPGYFGVRSDDELAIEYDLVPTPDVRLPTGWPPVIPNTAGLAGLALGGVRLVMRGSGRGLLIASLWRNGREQGVFVNLVRAR